MPSTPSTSKISPGDHCSTAPSAWMSPGSSSIPSGTITSPMALHILPASRARDGPFKIFEAASTTADQLQLSGAIDAITFPNLVEGVDVAFASVDVDVPQGQATVTFVGANGSYTVGSVALGYNQTFAAGESHVLEGDILNPTLELGPIREIILSFATTSSWGKVQILTIPREGPLDEFVTKRPPSTPTTIVPTTFDLLPHCRRRSIAPRTSDSAKSLELHAAGPSPAVTRNPAQLPIQPIHTRSLSITCPRPARVCTQTRRSITR